MDLCTCPGPPIARSSSHHRLLRLGDVFRQIPNVPWQNKAGSSNPHFDTGHYLHLWHEFLCLPHVLANTSCESSASPLIQEADRANSRRSSTSTTTIPSKLVSVFSPEAWLS